MQSRVIRRDICLVIERYDFYTIGVARADQITNGALIKRILLVAQGHVPTRRQGDAAIALCLFFYARFLWVEGGFSGVTINGQEYEILYYYTDFDQHDWPTKKFKVLDSELMPVVLEDGKVIGWGPDGVYQY